MMQGFEHCIVAQSTTIGPLCKSYEVKISWIVSGLTEKAVELIEGLL